MDRRARRVLFIAVVVQVTLGAAVAWAGSSGHIDLSWDVLSGGGAPAVSGSGQVMLNGSLGQTAIGPAARDDYDLGAGFWYNPGRWACRIYLPLLLRTA